MTHKNRKKHARILRDFRKIHRYTGVGLMVCFILIGMTGIALGIKKNSGDWILPETRKGNSSELGEWLTLEALENAAMAEAQRITGASETLSIDRMDIRKSKGIVKVIFKNDLLEVQLDGASGAVLHTGKRYSDLLEDLHDGSVVDDYLGIPRGYFKLFYTIICGSALLVFCATGFWLWYGPKYMKRIR